MRIVKFALCVVTALVAAPALGNNIVTNGSFENFVLPPSPPGQGYSVANPVSQSDDSVISDWGVFGSTAGVFFNSDVPPGSQAAFVDAGTTLYQDVGPVLPNTTYQLSLFARQTGDQPAQVGQLTLSLATGTGDPHSIIDPSTLTIGSSASAIPGATFAAVSPLLFTTGSSVSGDLFVLLADTGIGPAPRRTAQIYVDDVVLSTVPEPSLAAFLGLSALSLVGYRLVRRRRKS